ncbi:hypothetical protein BCR32DRAFT_329253 [Anaeromyces robustus]|jgi:hypothetical protein|uniref:Concanavalin A-like lectin/glucanase n=1 Tax=Anaeromyces robustus TaxID=1754192 RepID=A0A1Y1WU56_9FUNG|nr:hypothetical protein BCR32DRAFT_329253 [Anaeromyces robustus]|eukprot:ORX76674.1 hypothetical protein BCR32DRAFT_329253 [Anaeromyces robustus]
MDLCRKVTPDTGYVDITPYPIGYSDFSFLIWFIPLKPESKDIKTLFSYEKGTGNKNYQFSLDLQADGKLTFHLSNQDNSLSTEENLRSIESVMYDKVNIVCIVRRHNEIRMYLNNGLSGVFRTKEIIKCYSYEADDENSSNGNQIYFRLGAMTNSGLVATNQFDGSIDRFIFKLEALDEAVITSYAADLTNNFASAYSQSLPTYEFPTGDDLPPPY